MISKKNKLLYRFIIYFVTLCILWILFPPFYFKNDDVIMSMISNGYGQMNDKSNLIYHSNVLMGFLGGQLPSIFGILPYNYINIIFLIISFITVNEIVFKKINNFFISYLLVISSSFFILVTPTFSTISGYLAIAGLLKITEVKSIKNIKHLIFGLVLILTATLIRDEMVIFILIFTSIVVYKLFINNKKILVKYISVFFIIFCVTQIVNRAPYEDQKLAPLKAFAPVQYQITDYNADKFLINREIILESNQFTINDIKLIRNWFFVDNYLADSTRLTKLLKESSWSGAYNNIDIKEAISSSINLVSSYPLNIVLLSAIIIFFFSKRNLDLHILWILFVISIIFGAIIGRQLGYIYYPLLVFLFINNCLSIDYSKSFRKLIVVILSFSILGVNIFSNFSNRSDLEIARSEYDAINLEKLWLIGGGISLPHVFPLLGRNLKSSDLKLITSDWSIHSPNSNFQEFNSKNEFNTQLQSTDGINVAMSNYLLPLIQIYCKEKFGTDITEIKLFDKKFIRVSNIKCPSNQINIYSPTMEFNDGARGFVWLTDEIKDFTIINYSRDKYFGNYDLFFQNNPCNFDLSFTLESNNFKQTLSSKQGIANLQLALDPYQSLTVNSRLLGMKELCKANSEDKRLFLAKLVNNFD